MLPLSQLALRPLLESARSSTATWITMTDVKALFSALPDMHRLHAQFLEMLQERLDDWAASGLLGDLLMAHVRRLRWLGSSRGANGGISPQPSVS